MLQCLVKLLIFTILIVAGYRPEGPYPLVFDLSICQRTSISPDCWIEMDSRMSGNFCGEYRSRTDDLYATGVPLWPLPAKSLVVENIGVEPMTSCVQGRRSSQLS